MDAEHGKTYLAPEQKLAFVISGGGFRATLFHLGALIRLNELGLLPRLTHVSSVSGGSILAGQLGRQWDKLSFDANGVATNFKALVTDPILKFCGGGYDVFAVLLGLLMFGNTGLAISWLYDLFLYKKALLSAFPAHAPKKAGAANVPPPIETETDSAQRRGPVFFINSTNLLTGNNIRFTRTRIIDTMLAGEGNGNLRLATAVAASSAFPPLLSPLKLVRSKRGWVGARLSEEAQTEKASPEQVEGVDTQRLRKLPDTMYLVDGGVYDNMGLEPVWKIKNLVILCSDASGLFKPRSGWYWFPLSLLWRVVEVFNRQAYVMRVRYFTRSKLASRGSGAGATGAYWTISTPLSKFHSSGKLLKRESKEVEELASLGTRLWTFGRVKNRRLVNWGYVLADAAIRTYILEPPLSPAQQPFNDAPFRLVEGPEAQAI